MRRRKLLLHDIVWKANRWAAAGRARAPRSPWGPLTIPRDRRLHDRPTLAPRVTRSSSSCANDSDIPSSIPAMTLSRASFEGWSSCMTSSVLPPFSSKVTVVTAPSSLSSFVQTRRERGVTSRYRPKNAIVFEVSRPNSKRYLPPTRTSASQESRDTPVDFGAHHRLSSSGLVHASNTRRAGPLKVRVTTSSRSDFRSTVVMFFTGVGSLSLLASIDLLLPFEFLDNLVQRVEACVPELAVPLDPCRLFIQSAQAELAGPHAPDLLRGDEPCLLQNADML